MIETIVESMFYNKNTNMGTIVKIKFLVSNTG